MMECNPSQNAVSLGSEFAQLENEGRQLEQEEGGGDTFEEPEPPATQEQAEALDHEASSAHDGRTPPEPSMSECKPAQIAANLELESAQLEENGGHPEEEKEGGGPTQPDALALPVAQPDSPEAMKGFLCRKTELASPGKKASKRSWKNMVCVVQNGSLAFYKDHKHANKGKRYHGEAPVRLQGAWCDVAADYKKRSNVFRLRLTDGREYLFEAKNEAEMRSWVQLVSAVAACTPTLQDPAEEQPVPCNRVSKGNNQGGCFCFFWKKK